jgi:hypothetical protein
VGVFNVHSSRWDPRCRERQNAVFWEEVIDENGLEVGNDGQATHYWTRDDHEGKSVIDLTLVSRPITNQFILADGHTTVSDLEVIEWEVDVDRQEEAEYEGVVGWNLAAMTGEDAEAAEMLWAELAKERAHLDAECTADEVKQDARRCQEAISSFLHATASKIRM